MNYQVLVVSPRGFVHSEAFSEVAETLLHGLRALGHDVVLTRGLSALPGRRPIVLGANMVPRLKVVLPPDAILYNLEQVDRGSAWLTPELVALFRQYPAWDYSALNLAQWEALGVPRPALLPIS